MRGYLCGESLPKLALDENSKYLREGKLRARLNSNSSAVMG